MLPRTIRAPELLRIDALAVWLAMVHKVEPTREAHHKPEVDHGLCPMGNSAVPRPLPLQQRLHLLGLEQFQILAIGKRLKHTVVHGDSFEPKHHRLHWRLWVDRQSAVCQELCPPPFGSLLLDALCEREAAAVAVGLVFRHMLSP
jgi:hypothetical protein